MGFVLLEDRKRDPLGDQCLSSFPDPVKSKNTNSCRLLSHNPQDVVDYSVEKGWDPPGMTQFKRLVTRQGPGSDGSESPIDRCDLDGKESEDPGG